MRENGVVERSPKAAWAGGSDDTRRLNDVSVSYCQSSEEEEVEADHIVFMQDVKEGVVLPLVWGNPDAMAYVKLRPQYLDARRFGTLQSHVRLSRIVHDGNFRVTMYGKWRLRQEAWQSVKVHSEDGRDMPVLRDELEAAYVANLAKYSWMVEADGLSKHWLECCMLP